MTYNVFSGTLNHTDFTSLHFPRCAVIGFYQIRFHFSHQSTTGIIYVSYDEISRLYSSPDQFQRLIKSSPGHPRKFPEIQTNWQTLVRKDCTLSESGEVKELRWRSCNWGKLSVCTGYWFRKWCSINLLFYKFCMEMLRYLGLPSPLWRCWLGHLTRKNPSPIWPIMCLVGR